MSLRTYINGFEWLGNNVLPKVIKDELTRQGCNFDGNGCCEVTEIKDLNGLVVATEKYIKELTGELRDIFKTGFLDLLNQINRTKVEKDSVTDLIECYKDESPLFLTINLLKYIGADNYYTIFDTETNKWVYKFKVGKSCDFECF